MALAGVLDQRSSLIGAVVGLIVGGVGGFVAGSQSFDPAMPPPPVVSAVSTATPDAKAGESTALPMAQAQPSFAQQGEDLVIQQMLFQLGIRTPPTYLDIGAHEPVRSNNTYLFYALGGRGVLVEPNPTYADKLRSVRPRDVVLEYGVGITDQAEADYYVLSGDGQLNTFSKEQADSLVRLQRSKIEKVVKRRLVPINAIMEQHFKDRAPDILSIDVEGLDYEILKTLDWTRWRPRIICVETSMVEDGKVDQNIVTLLEKLGYVVRGGSFVNTIFLDEKTWRAEAAAKAAGRDGGDATHTADAGQATHAGATTPRADAAP